MNFKKNGGFTLVELIVVIAILGILAGIGIPAYGKYVEKAQISVDNQNLNMLHNVFVVSCVEHAVDPATVQVVTIDFDGTTFRGITQVSGASAAYYGRRSGGTSEDKNALIVTSFNGYIGSEGIQFKSKDMTADKIIKGIEEGVATEGNKYTPDANGNYNVNYGGGSLSFKAEDVETVKNSTFGKKIGAQELLDKVDYVSNIAALGGDAINKVFNDSKFQLFAAGAMGLDVNDPDLKDKLNAKHAELAAEMMAKNPGMTESEARSKLNANAAVLFAAHNSANMTDQEVANITTMLSNDGAKSSIINTLNSDTGTALSQAAIAYGMYTAYAYAKDPGDKSLINKTEDPISILNGLDDDNFQAYVASEQGQADLQAYLSSMDMISSSSKDTTSVSHLVVNGFNNGELSGLIGDLLK